MSHNNAPTPRSLTPLLVAALWTGHCASSPPEEAAVQHFAVTIQGVAEVDNTGQWVPRPVATLSDEPLSFGRQVRLDLTIDTLPGAGNFQGFVQIHLVPGRVVSVRDGEGNERQGNSIAVMSGQSTEATVVVENAYGLANLWVEEVGLELGPAEGAACDDGLDNDGDGWVDYPNDPGCFFRNDNSERRGSHAVGVTDPIPFYNPRLSQVQGCALTPELDRQAVTIDRGEMYVTAVTSNGFYVTDYSYVEGGCDVASGCCGGGRFAHIFAFNFNAPRGLRVCDRLESVGGILADFYGFTELNFPSWTRYDVDEDSSNGLTLMRDAPAELTAIDCPLTSAELTAAEISNRPLMETYESALVHVVNAELPTQWVDCDFNGNGEAAYNPNHDEFAPADEIRVPDGYCVPNANNLCSEAACSAYCDRQGCAELTTYRKHGQYPLRVEGASILAVTNATVPGFNPRALAQQGVVTIERLGGVLKEFSPLEAPWIIEPRCRQDIVIAGNEAYGDVPIYRRCVPSEETGDYEDPI
jgi:hypothetical protein